MTKWPDRPHWKFGGSYLGADAWGDWIGFPAGSRFTRPDMDVVIPNDHVALVPAAGATERGWLAAFHGPGGDFRLYVDIATPPDWDGTVVRAVDLDLDVIETVTGRIYVDDEDEFADHHVRWSYPDHVVAGARASCQWVESAVRAGTTPFDGTTHLPWLERLAQ